MQALIYIAEALLQYLLVTAFFLRLILPLVRANMRNPLAQAVMRVTNPIIMPLRRVLPPVGRVDTASVLALLLVQVAVTAFIMLLRGLDPSSLPNLARYAGFNLLEMALQFYRICMFIYVLLGWIAPAAYSPATDLLGSLCEPPLRVVRRIIPPIAQLDLSPVFVLIALTALLLLLPSIFF